MSAFKQLIWLFVLLGVYCFITYSIEYLDIDGLINPAHQENVQDKYRQGYLIGPDSYYYLNQSSLTQQTSDSNLVIRLYHFIGLMVEKYSSKEPKYFLFYIPFIVGCLIIASAFITMKRDGSPLLALILSIILASSPSFFKNTQLGNIDHNSFYIFALVVIFYIFKFDYSPKQSLIKYFLLFTISISVSSFWGSWFLLLVPVFFLLIVRINFKNKKVLLISLSASVALIVIFFNKVFESQYFNIVKSKVLNSFSLIEAGAANRLNHTQELEGINVFKLIQLEPVLGLFILSVAVFVLNIKNNKTDLRVSLAYITISIVYLLLTVLFVRTSIFTVIAVVLSLSVLLQNISKNRFIRVCLYLGFPIVFALNCWNIFWLNAQTERLTDNQYRHYILIKKLTEKNAIILSWWDYGYHLNAISQRQTFLDPGSNSSPERLKLFSNIVLDNNSDSLEKIRTQICNERGIYFDECSHETVPVYLYLNDSFDYFFPVIKQFASSNVQKILGHNILDEIYECQKSTRLIQCGKYEFKYDNERIALLNQYENINNLIIRSAEEIYNQDVGIGNDVLVLFEDAKKYRLAKTDKHIADTLLFKGLFYDELKNSPHEMVFRQEQAGSFSLIKLK